MSSYVDDAERHRIARVVSSARLARGLHQGDVAAAAGLPDTAISRIETAHLRAPRLTADLLGRLAGALRVYPEAFLPKEAPYQGLAMLRGRINTHFLCLAEWSRLNEILQHCLVEIHRFRPDVVGLSLLLFGRGDEATCTARGATLTDVRPVEQSFPWEDERVARGTSLPRHQQEEGRWWNLLSAEQAVIPGCNLVHTVVETALPGGVLWLALSRAPPTPADDPEFFGHGAKTGLLWHVADALGQALSRLRQFDDAQHAAPTTAGILERLHRLESFLGVTRPRR